MTQSSQRPATEKSAGASAAAAPLKSMTGFAEARGEYNGFALRVSLRSVNHRFLDLHLRIPEGLESLEVIGTDAYPMFDHLVPKMRAAV